MMMTNPIAFSTGSNLGNRLRNLREAADRLSSIGRITAMSDVFETEPWGVTDQPRFLNACLLMEDIEMEPKELLNAVKNIERDIGRKDGRRWGERKIDIDILLTGGRIISTPELTIPHINMYARDFVLVPLCQILPDWRHPQRGLNVAEMASALQSETPPIRITGL